LNKEKTTNLGILVAGERGGLVRFHNGEEKLTRLSWFASDAEAIGSTYNLFFFNVEAGKLDARNSLHNRSLATASTLGILGAAVVDLLCGEYFIKVSLSRYGGKNYERTKAALPSVAP